MAATGFLDLPAELRLEIYEWVNADNTVPTSEFKGLYLSCRQIKEEMDDACITKPTQMVQKILNDDAIPFTFTPTKNFSKVRQLTIRLPANYLLDQAWDDYPGFDNLHKLLSLPLESVTVKLTYADANQHELFDGRANKKFARYTVRIARGWLPGFAEPNARKIVFMDLKVRTLIPHPAVHTIAIRDSWRLFYEREDMTLQITAKHNTLTLYSDATFSSIRTTQSHV
jgi:hypothetical protein